MVCRRPSIWPMAGIKVYLSERSAAIGGVMAQLDKTFPTNDCAMCTMAPRLVEIGKHKDIEILTLSEVEHVDGQPGNFTVRIKQQPRFVISDEMHGLRRLHDRVSSNDAVRVRSGTGRAKSNLPAVPTSCP